MLAIRMQRTGRKGHAQYRMVVQDSRFSPSSGRVVAYLGSYDPHTKETRLDSDKAKTYLNNGAQPSGRVIRIFKEQKIGLPAWIKESGEKQRPIRNQEKLRRNRPAEPKSTEGPAADAGEPAAEVAAEPQTAEPADTAAPAAENEAPAEPPAEEASSESAAEATADGPETEPQAKDE